MSSSYEETMTIAKSLLIGVGVGVLIVVSAIFIPALFVTPNPGGANNACPAMWGVPNFSGTGFLMSNGKEYVLKPNTTAILEINYTNIYNATSIFKDSSHYFQSLSTWYQMSSSSNNYNFKTVSAASVGLFASPLDVSLAGNHSLIARYQINATYLAQHGAFWPDFPSTCAPSPLIVVGNSYYSY